MRYLLLLLPLLLFEGDASTFEYRTPNFVVFCRDSYFAVEVGEAAEHYRAKHAKEWLGKAIPNWYSPCPIRVNVINEAGAGATTFSFEQGEVFGWDMQIQGTPQGLMDSVIPHEVLHTVFASHFRRPLPRWADEGAATYEEDESEKQHHRQLAHQVAGTEQQIPIRRLLVMKEYPDNMGGIAVLYAQGFYLAEFLIDRKGRQEFVKFLETAHRTDWDRAFEKHYGFKNQEIAYTAAWREHSQPEQQVASRYEIKMFTGPNCRRCEEDRQKVLPLLKAKGLIVEILDYDRNLDLARKENVIGLPTYIIYENGKRIAKLRESHSISSLLKRRH
ncbi:hypothetical protein [uncultured Gimesia sp.]|uniref:hypothetical protein n=1 Tax=uncultured Gimesia sp. TaxID=1678688 RepID=UPI0030DC7C5A|tara:strand:+ start:1479 stop:2471 length:993 start_codon:yes stop_codon:yes gene_type:complete